MKKLQKLIQKIYIITFIVCYIICILNAEDLTILSIKFWIIFIISGILTNYKIDRRVKGE